MKIFHPIQMSKHSADLNDGDIACAVSEQAVHRIKAGDGDLKSDLIVMALDQDVDENIRGSILETLAAALIPDCQDELVVVLKKILSNDDEDPSVHHTAIGMYVDFDVNFQEELLPLVEAMSDYQDHRGKYSDQILGYDKYADDNGYDRSECDGEDDQ